MMGKYQDIENKTFLVTGASSGIGRAIAIALGQQKASVVITGRNEKHLNQTLKNLTPKSRYILADLTNTEDREQLVDSLPLLDGVCHAAGIINPFPVRFLDQAQFEKVFSINATAPILLTSRLLGRKKINDNASILFISSIASDYAYVGGSIYSCSKASLEAFSRNITLEYASKRIRSNCLKPALVETPILEKALELAPPDIRENYASRYPLGIGTPEDVAAAALFFLSEASRWITGATLTMDGGLTAGM